MHHQQSIACEEIVFSLARVVCGVLFAFFVVIVAAMPELPEVEAARRLWDKVCVGKKVSSCEVVQDNIVFEGVSPDEFSKRMVGSTVVAAHRKGKQLWIELDTRPYPCFHLGMSGSFAAKQKGTKDIECAQYVNTKVDASTWPPKFWKMNLVMADQSQLAFVAVIQPAIPQLVVLQGSLDMSPGIPESELNPARVQVRRFERVRLMQSPETVPPIRSLPLPLQPACSVFRRLDVVCRLICSSLAPLPPLGRLNPPSLTAT